MKEENVTIPLAKLARLIHKSSVYEANLEKMLRWALRTGHLVVARHIQSILDDARSNDTMAETIKTLKSTLEELSK